MTYKRCQDKFQTATHTDTTYIQRTDTVAVPAATAGFQVKTDTTYLTQIVREGRAVVTYVRTPQVTRVQADCLPDTIYQQVRVPLAVTTRNVFEKPQTGWRTAAIVALFAAVLGWLFFLVELHTIKHL
ncbi:hypothetical protein [Fibrella aquatilis]|uniref:Uncharacterized protein n=1 Tax=Fibrella aquatilis TaxID=2817059 RepID=A0A939GD19_9BACT|nr:hypothetical protein [Fibrella aquatilis]MBO0934605.1 hypothetical protein [Fibrella aquatilis]